MAVIIRGTTPTVKIVFKTIDVDSIAKAFLVVSQNHTDLIVRDMDALSFSKDSEDNYLSWTLSQEDTLSLITKGKVQIVCDWVLADGTRGRSKFAEYGIEDPGIEEVIELGS